MGSFAQINAESLYFNLTLIDVFQMQCAGAQNQNNKAGLLCKTAQLRYEYVLNEAKSDFCTQYI